MNCVIPIAFADLKSTSTIGDIPALIDDLRSIFTTNFYDSPIFVYMKLVNLMLCSAP